MEQRSVTLGLRSSTRRDVPPHSAVSKSSRPTPPRTSSSKTLNLGTRRGSGFFSPSVARSSETTATCSYNFLHTRIDMLWGEEFGEGRQRDRHFRGVGRFPPTKRFSELPAFALLAAPTLALAIVGFMTFASFHTPTGLYVELVPARCEEYDVVDKLIVLHVADTGKLFLNQEQEDWSSLAARLSEIYRMRKDRTLYLLSLIHI